MAQHTVPLQFRWKTLDKRLKLFLIFSFVFTLGNSSNQFLLLRAKEAGNPLALVILFYLVYNLIASLVSYPAARLSDRVGRKTVMLPISQGVFKLEPALC